MHWALTLLLAFESAYPVFWESFIVSVTLASAAINLIFDAQVTSLRVLVAQQNQSICKGLGRASPRTPRKRSARSLLTTPRRIPDAGENAMRTSIHSPAHLCENH